MILYLHTYHDIYIYISQFYLFILYIVDHSAMGGITFNHIFIDVLWMAYQDRDPKMASRSPAPFGSSHPPEGPDWLLA